MNPWLWIFLILLPMFVLGVKPGAPGWLYMGRLLAAILVGYVLLNLWLHASHRLDREAFNTCMGDTGESDSFRSEECGIDHVIADGASNVFYLLFGWVPTLGYVGLWEWIWRRKHNLSKKSEKCPGYMFSCILVMISIPVIVFFGAVLLVGVTVNIMDFIYAA